MKLGRLNVGLDHLSHIETGEEPTNLDEGLTNTQLFAVRVAENISANIIHFLTMGTTLEGYTSQQKKELVVRATDFYVIAGHLYKMVSDEIQKHYVPNFK